MGHHLTKDGDFRSDKYNWCPEGFFALKFSDPKARQAIRRYAELTGDSELEEDLITACNKEERVTMSQKLTKCRIVLYRVNKPEGHEELRNNAATYLPAMVVTPFGDDVANLQVFVDGPAGTVWLTSVKQGDEPGQWQWPPRV